MQISPRCGTSNEEKKAGCGIASASGAEFSKLIAETDFNEWVAHLMFMPSRVSDVGQDFLGREVMKIIFKRKDGELVVGCLASKKKITCICRTSQTPPNPTPPELHSIFLAISVESRVYAQSTLLALPQTSSASFFPFVSGTHDAINTKLNTAIPAKTKKTQPLPPNLSFIHVFRSGKNCATMNVAT